MDRTEVRVDFGNVNFGDQTARLGVKIAREDLTLEEADRLFCGRRLFGTVSITPPDSNQKRLPGLEDDPVLIEESFDTKQIGVSPHGFSLGLTFNLKSIDCANLVKFAKKTGVLSVVSVKDLDGDDSMENPGWEHESDRDQPEEPEDPHGPANREAYTLGCEAATDGKSKRCPFKKGDPLRDYWLRGYDETAAEGGDSRQCSECQTEYSGSESDSCPECGSVHFVRLEATEAT